MTPPLLRLRPRSRPPLRFSSTTSSSGHDSGGGAKSASPFQTLQALLLTLFDPRFFRAAKQAFEEEQSNTRREVENTIGLLKDTARKHTQAEKAVGGTIHPSATFFLF